MNSLDKLNNKNLLDDFNPVIQTGTENLLEFPERKEILTNDWAEENGQEYDLNLVRFKDQEVTLSCAIMANDDTAFWLAYNAFFAEVTKPGFQNLYIWDRSKTYGYSIKKPGLLKRH